MRFTLVLPFFLLSSFFTLVWAQQPGAQVMIVGFDHLSQLYNQQPSSDVFSAKKQAEIGQINACLLTYAPDMIMVEAERSEQPRIDSLYRLYVTDKLNLRDLKEGRGETFQVGFALAKRLRHERVYCVDHYEATAQSLLTEGDNIDLYRQGLQQLQNFARPLKKRVQQDSLSIYDYIRTINQPATVALTHNLFYNLPALVVNGDFSKTATNTVDVSRVDRRYIGAEFIGLYYMRNLKIYSNALIAQRAHQGQRILLLFGQTHVGVLQELFRANPAYKLALFSDYCP